jgi:hypothetical protein
MKLWIDDVRPAPNNGIGYAHLESVNEAKRYIQQLEYLVASGIDWLRIELIDIDHDAGDFVTDGGDYIKLLDWLEETGRNYPIRIHSMNPVGVANMRQIIQRNGWTEVK